MPSTSAIVNRALKMRVTPLLRKVGFDKVEARRAWHWRQDLVWVFTIRSIGGKLGDRIWDRYKPRLQGTNFHDN